MKDCTPAPKRLIICCDGTWQSSVSGKRNIPSNVTRLARAIARAGEDANGKQWQQLVYYDSGVGTGSLSWLEQARQGGTGDGLVVNVLEAYNFLVNNYAEGDEIFCFGFSRGAFTARAIAGLVTDIGIFKPTNMQSFPPLWAVYQQNTAKHDFRKTKDYFQFIDGVRPMVPKSEEHKVYVRKPWEVKHDDIIRGFGGLTWPNSNAVQVVGVFDTVGSLGMADTRLINDRASRKRFEYLNVRLSPFIKHAFHALSLDERREPFTPTLWYIPNKEALKEEEAAIAKDAGDWPELKAHRATIDKEIADFQAKHKPDLYQVWFPGVHINIGGGSDADSRDAEGLSNVTFAWMVQQLGSYLAFEPWTWDEEIPKYQERVIQEEALYDGMKDHMTKEEEQEYGGLVKKSMVENAEETISGWGHRIWDGGKKTLGLSKEIEMVPLSPEYIKDPPTTSGGVGGKRIRWGIQEVQDSYTLMYKLMGDPKERTPGCCIDRSREDGKPLHELGKTNEFIHPAVWWRYKTMKNAEGGREYRSRALEGFKRTQDPTYKSWGYLRQTADQPTVWIPEWFMKPTNKYLTEANLGEWADAKGDESWQHAEWTYLDNVTDMVEMQKQVAQFYVDAQQAAEKMKIDGREFPWEVDILKA